MEGVADNLLGMVLMEMRPRALIAGGLVLAAVVAAALFLLWPERWNTHPPAESTPQHPPSSSVAQFPPLPSARIIPPRVARHPPDVGESRTLCDGCLNEQAVLDVVETYLRLLDPIYLQGEIWAHPLAEVAPETPGEVDGLPKLPPGLLEAPELNPMGMSIDTRSYPVETTWIVWVQTGWKSHQAIENQIWVGTLPEVARSWPPIKDEVYVAVDSRTGELRPSGIFHMTSKGLQPPHPPHYEAVLDATRERAARWLRSGGSELDSSS